MSEDLSRYARPFPRPFSQLTVHAPPANTFCRPQASTVCFRALGGTPALAEPPHLQLVSRTRTRRGTGRHFSWRLRRAVHGSSLATTQLPELHGLLQVCRRQGRRLRAVQAVQACLQLALP